MSLDANCRKLGLTSLSDMQRETIHAVMNTEDDVVVLSPTGTGKTLAYLLPLTEMMADDTLSAVVVVPGRELALQSCQVMKSMACPLRPMALYGGRPTMDEHRELRKIQPNIVFGTPGRLNDHIAKGNLPVDKVRCLVIDEFDKCLEMGFMDEMTTLISSLPAVRRRILLSATDSETIPQYVNMQRMTLVDYRQDHAENAERIHLYTVKSDGKDKLPTLEKLLLDFGDESTVVFLNHRESVERTARYLMEKGFAVSLFHGGLEQREREAALYRFANGSANILVTTDLASRGLDVPQIDNVVHYHLPETHAAYIHRTGRTARWDRQGRAFFLLSDGETLPYLDFKSLPLFTPLSHREGQEGGALPTPAKPKMVTLYIGKGKRDKLSKGDIVGFLCKKGGLQSSEIGMISVMERYTYVAVSRQRVKSVLANVSGEKIKGVKTIVETVR
ncbi:MAG: DEAD/DEAH box helicase [Prevotella sp.]|nr:DEAD/DEAH box helicase [Prevotella sp.]